MAKFPPGYGIRYTEAAPSGRGPSAPANINVDTGGQFIAAGIGALGDALKQTAKAEQQVELSTLVRKQEELWNAGFLTFQSTSDIKEQTQIYNKLKEDDAKLQSENPAVQRVFQIHRNNTMPDREKTFATQYLATRRQNVKDSALINIQNAMEHGDIGNAAKHYMILKQFNFMSQADAEQKVNDLPVNTVFSQARTLMDTNPQAAIAMLNGLKNLRPEQLDEKDQLVKYAQSISETNEDAAIKLASMARDKFRNLSSSQKDIKAEEIIQELGRTTTGRTYEDQVEKIRKWQSGEPETKHPLAVAKFQTMATDIWRGATTKQKFDEELAKAMRLPDSDPNAMSDTEATLVSKDSDTELKTTQAQMLTNADELAGKALVDYRSDMDLFAVMQSATPAEKKTLTDKRKLQMEVLNQYNREMSDFLASSPKVSKKEFEQFRDSKRYEYINHRTELEKTIRENIETFERPKPATPQRKPGESVADYLKRTKQE